MPSSFPTTEWQKFLATPWINWCQWRGNLASWDLDNIETTVWVCLSDVFVAIKSHVFWAELAIAVDGLQQLFEQGIDMRQYWSPWMCIDVHTEQRDADTTCTCPYIYIYMHIYIYICMCLTATPWPICKDNPKKQHAGYAKPKLTSCHHFCSNSLAEVSVVQLGHPVEFVEPVPWWRPWSGWELERLVL